MKAFLQIVAYVDEADNDKKRVGIIDENLINMLGFMPKVIIIHWRKWDVAQIIIYLKLKSGLGCHN